VEYLLFEVICIICDGVWSSSNTYTAGLAPIFGFKGLMGKFPLVANKTTPPPPAGCTPRKAIPGHFFNSKG